MIIDVHSHNFALHVVRRAMSGMCKAVEGRLTPSGDGTLENQLDSMELAGVDKAVLCPIATKPNHFEIILRRSLSILTGEMGERAKRMIIPLASVHPEDPEWSAHLKTIAQSGIKGVKVHPYYQNFSLSDPKVWPFFHEIAELDLVVQCHAGADIGYPGRLDACGPNDIATLLKNVKGLRFIAAHLGGCAGFAPHTTDQLLELGAYIDTSALAQFWHRDEEMRLLRSWPRDHILFATDFPWTNYTEIINWVKSVREAADWPALFADNALRLLNGI